jgi:arylsulfatase A-like enzyme
MDGFPLPIPRRLAWALGAAVVALVVLCSLAPLAGVSLPSRRPLPRPSGPNLLVLIGDDHAADTLGVAGDHHGATPRLDALAKQGVFFRRAYCNSPLCTPSRQSIATGRLPHAVGVTRLNTPLPDSAVTYGDWLERRGYVTGAFGKMHFNSSKKHGFNDRVDTNEWEKWLKHLQPHVIDRRRPWRPVRDPAPEWLNASDRPYGLPDAAMESTFYVEKAGQFFGKHKSDPFTLVIGFPEPHSPFKFPDDWPRKFSPVDFEAPSLSDADRAAQPKIFKEITPAQTKGIQAAYYTSVSYLDAQVGRVLDELDVSGLAENTIVVYFGDNGYLRGLHGRFEKHCLYEQAVHIPLIIRWPKGLPAGRVVDDMVEGVDILPTVLELMGVEAPSNLQGRSVADLARGRPGAVGREVVFSEYLENEEAMARDKRYKLIVGTGHRRRQDGYVNDNPTPGPYERLFDLDTDPSENIDLAGRPELAAVQNRLLDALFERITTTRNPDDQAPQGLSKIETIRKLLVPRD